MVDWQRLQEFRGTYKTKQMSEIVSEGLPYLQEVTNKMRYLTYGSGVGFFEKKDLRKFSNYVRLRNSLASYLDYVANHPSTSKSDRDLVNRSVVKSDGDVEVFIFDFIQRLSEDREEKKRKIYAL